MRSPSLALLAVLVVASPLLPVGARADDASDALKELKRGYALKQAGDCRGAIPHFAASQSLLPGAKAALNLADCEQRLGDLAAARVHAQQGRELALEQNDPELVAVADAQIAAIDEKLPRAPTPVPKTSPAAVSRGEPPASPAAPSRVETPAPPPSEADVRDGSARRAVAYALGGVGVVGIGLGSAYGLVAIAKNGSSKADGHCDATGCDATGKQLREDALGAATVSTVAFATGLAALAAGIVVYLTAPKGVRVGTALGASFQGVSVQGSW